ncbi:reverse transcriptase/maturase family protein [Mesorhizobium sp. M1409]|uniref:hypothetical protein n=1 Tax=unclassified Mesorhizobium TaxID=325217 RepID=UPI00333C8499
MLDDKIFRNDILRHAYVLARANAGSPGVDGAAFAQIEAEGVGKWLAGLRGELVSKTYRPQPGAGDAPEAAKLELEPIFEADFEDSAYGYRPRRSAREVVKETRRLICRGHTEVVDADLSKYFDTIPHSALLKSVSRRIVDRHVLRLDDAMAPFGA